MADDSGGPREPNTQQVLLRLPHELHARVKRLADKRTVPVAVMARILLVDALDREEKSEAK